MGNFCPALPKKNRHFGTNTHQRPCETFDAIISVFRITRLADSTKRLLSNTEVPVTVDQLMSMFFI